MKLQVFYNSAWFPMTLNDFEGHVSV